MLAQKLSLTDVIIGAVVGQQFQDPNQQQFNQQPPQQVRNQFTKIDCKTHASDKSITGKLTEHTAIRIKR